MSQRGIIEGELPQQCDECGQVAELRPYGPGGKKICFPCLESHPEWEFEAKARLAHLIFGRVVAEGVSMTRKFYKETEAERRRHYNNVTVCQCGHSLAWHRDARGKYHTICNYPGCTCTHERPKVR